MDGFFFFFSSSTNCDQERGWEERVGSVGTTHEGVLPAKQLLARLRLCDLAHADLPRPALAPRHLGAQGPTHNLVPVAHAYDLDPVLRQHFLGEIDQADDPRVVIEGIESCRLSRAPLAKGSQPNSTHPFKLNGRSTSRKSTQNVQSPTYDSP